MPKQWGIGELAASLVELILPRPCAGCGDETEAGGVLCPRCQEHLREVPRRVERPIPLGFPTWALGPYSDTRRGVIIAMKERGNHAVRGHMGAVVAAGIEYLRARGDIPETALLVPAPTRASSARSRGGDPVTALCESAVSRLPGWRTLQALATSESSADQSELTAGERADNMRAAVLLRPCAQQLTGQSVVLVDDVVTTGATLRASAARIRAVGGDVVGAIVLADA
ncbi:ComF family protein [Corynebacterium sp. FDAARGOS 1242]|uniref:ComF family protein n=1 Tax=Corynebacterium sp. FDAARGOS 1242 TaxID=2778078 RepID=UPI00194FA075|nr:phosphoribosyltransferase family protein [Corynebacterium sp. FDAARGOS 1242]QRP97106.1 ComF family protein [Corynebacterium sp. FDAARGOS 1242]